MSLMRWSKFLAAPVVIVLAISGAPNAVHAGSFGAALVRCSDVVAPATFSGGLLGTCGTDPLTSGTVSIDDTGDVTVDVDGAHTNTKYVVDFVALDGSAYTAISTPSFMTDNHGNASLTKKGLFTFGETGAGNVVVSSGSEVEFVSGVLISPNGLTSGRDFEPTLVRCASVLIPKAITSPTCGTDPLSSGHVDIENDDGDVTIKISGAAANTTYTATMVSQSGASTPLGMLSETDSKGNGAFVVKPGAFSQNQGVSGTIELLNGSMLEFLSGFTVSEHPVSPIVSEAMLIRCGDSNHPIFANCGSDPLGSGSYQVDQKGNLTVKVSGAAHNTNYEAWFRPLDSNPLNPTEDADVDTGLAVPTDKNGNANVHTTTPPFESGDTASGAIIIKQQGTGTQPDEFDPGFVIP